VKTTQYVRQEKAIAAADKGGIRERWMWGLRLLRDPDAFAPGSSQLRPGVADEQIAAATSGGLKLSAREIQYRLRCARAYPTEAEIAQALAQFETWWALIQADFPAYETPDDEPPADHRTPAEQRHARARALMDLVGQQATLFDVSQFEPITTTLEDLEKYAVEMDEVTARFAERDRQRRAYLNSLINAAGGDMSMTWREAQDRLNAAEPDARDDTYEQEDPPL
jgi:hypothetical protein